MEKSRSIFDFIVGDSMTLDESPTKFRDIEQFIEEHKQRYPDGFETLSITFTTSKSTKLKTKNTKKPQFINKVLPIKHLPFWRETLDFIFGDASYFFYIDYQKRGARLVHVHGVLINPHIKYSEMLCKTIEIIAQKRLGMVHDIRPCHSIKSWSDYCKAKTFHTPIIHEKSED